MLFETEMRDNPRLKTVTSRVLNPVFVPEEKEIPQESRDARLPREAAVQQVSRIPFQAGSDP